MKYNLSNFCWILQDLSPSRVFNFFFSVDFTLPISVRTKPPTPIFCFVLSPNILARFSQICNLQMFLPFYIVSMSCFAVSNITPMNQAHTNEEPTFHLKKKKKYWWLTAFLYLCFSWLFFKNKFSGYSFFFSLDCQIWRFLCTLQRFHSNLGETWTLEYYRILLSCTGFTFRKWV